MIIHGISIFFNLIFLIIPLFIPCKYITNTIEEYQSQQSYSDYGRSGYGSNDFESSKENLNQFLYFFLTFCNGAKIRK